VADSPTIPVVAAVIVREERYLLGRRPMGKRHAGLWEFPGGKVLEGESLLEAARRELDEELALRATAAGETLFSAADPGSPFVVHFVEIVAEGEPRPSEHSEVGWLDLTELGELPLAPSDAAFASWLSRDPAEETA
jgi:8-oxo-dGTP diphosphatase